MKNPDSQQFNIVILVMPYFNLATTLAFLDPFRINNYLSGSGDSHWTLVSSQGGEVPCSNGLNISTEPIANLLKPNPDLVIVSSSWTPEVHHTLDVTKALVQWSRRGAKLAALDTGTFILARAGLLNNHKATVHYEHIDALSELFPELSVSEDLFVVDGDRMTCCGGMASVDLALHLLRQLAGENRANAVARYLFHHDVRGLGVSQNPNSSEPFGHMIPSMVRRAIDLMELHLETPLPIPDLCQKLCVSQRHLGRLFLKYVRKSPVKYYRDIRLDRARGLVTQTELKLSEIAVATGFSSQVHFSRAYHAHFGLPPSKDRIEGRVPFEFRAWPMHNPKGD